MELPMYSRLLLSLFLGVWLLPSFTFGQDKKQDADPEVARLLQEKIDRLAKEVKELEAKQAKLKVKAEEDARIILGGAKAQAARIKAEAEVQAARIINEAYLKDPDLYVFLKKVDAMKMLLGDKKVILVIPGKSELFKFLEPPEQDKIPKKSTEGKDIPPKGLPGKLNRSAEFRQTWQQEFGRLVRKMEEEGRLVIPSQDIGNQGLDFVVPKPLTPKKAK